MASIPAREKREKHKRKPSRDKQLTSDAPKRTLEASKEQAETKITIKNQDSLDSTEHDDPLREIVVHKVGHSEAGGERSADGVRETVARTEARESCDAFHQEMKSGGVRRQATLSDVIASTQDAEMVAIQGIENEEQQELWPVVDPMANPSLSLDNNHSAETRESHADKLVVAMDKVQPQADLKEPESSIGSLPWDRYRCVSSDQTPFLNICEGSFMDNDELENESDCMTSYNESKIPDGNKVVSIYEAISHFEESDSFLTSQQAPPLLQESVEQKVERKYIDDLKLNLAEEDIREYLKEFEDEVQKEILMIGSISLEDVQQEEKRLREDHLAFQERLSKQQQERMGEIVVAMERAKRHVMKRFKEKHHQVQMREEHMLQKDRLIQDQIHRAFRHSEDQLLKALKKRKGEVQTMYGDLTFADGQYGGSRGRRWKVDWNRTPQPIQVRLRCLRGIKDKLPKNRYVIMVSLYDRLGGHVMRWSNLRGHQWGGATLPLKHAGEFYNVELQVEQSIFTVCPSRPDIRPGMVLLFELFMLRGNVTASDHVVAWGCFPVCDGDFNIVDGKFKCPMLRGEVDPSIDKFETIESLIASDLDHWLGNLYFEVIKLPRYMAGQREYEVELQFSSGLVCHPSRLDITKEAADIKRPIVASLSDIGSHASLHSSRTAIENGLGNKQISFPGSSSPSAEQEPKAVSLFANDSQMISTSIDNLRKRSHSKGSVAPTNSLSRPVSVHGSRKIIEYSGSDHESDSNSDLADDEIHSSRKELDFKPVKGHPGLFCKLYYDSPADAYSKRAYTILPKTPLLSRRKGARRQPTHTEQLAQHSFHVRSKWSSKGHIPKQGREKVQYVGRMLLSELGLAQLKSKDFWAMSLALLVTWWLRLYIHYLGQWLLLQAIRIPINRFQLLPYTVNLNYQSTLLRTREELGIVVVGPLANVLLLIVFLLLASFVRTLFGRFSNIFSRCAMAYGINTILDPVWIAIVDSASLGFEQRGVGVPIGDAFKLYWHFDRYYNNDNVTVFVSLGMTLFLYSVTASVAAAVVYLYFLKLHNNARLMDIYWRLKGSETDFFLPSDLELTNEELKYICSKAEQWRGDDGQRRKTTVHDYVWQQEGKDQETCLVPDDSPEDCLSSSGERTTHVAIYTIHLDGLRELYRHFLRLPNGAVTEVFGEMNTAGLDELVQDTLRETTGRGDARAIDVRRTSDASSIGWSTHRSSIHHLHVPLSSDAQV